MPDILDPKTGRTGTITPDDIPRALRDGLQLSGPVDVFDPRTQKTGTVEPANVPQALSDGLVPVGSRAHKVVTTSKLESFGRGAVQGATFGFGDEIAGALESAAGSLGIVPDKTYRQARDESRANFGAAEEANPLTSMAGNIAGGVATAAIPTGGVLSMASTAGKTGLAGSKIAQAGYLGAKLGGLTGLGNSTADSLGGMAHDTITGAETGGALGAATQAVFPLLSAGAKAAKDTLKQTFDPILQRMQALGAKPGDVKKLGGYKVIADAVDEFTNAGGFEKIDGHYPAASQLLEKNTALLDNEAAKMHTLIEGQPLPAVKSQTILDDFQLPLFMEHVGAGDPLQRDNARNILNAFQQQIEETGGDLPRLWDLKKQWGASVTYAAKNPLQAGDSTKVAMTKEATNLLGDIIKSHTNDIVAQNPGMKSLGELNKTYSNLSKIQHILLNTVEEQAQKGGPGVPKMSDYVKAAAAGGGLGAMTGVPGLGGMAGAAALGVGAAARSTGGRLARAKIGEMIGLGQQGLMQKTASEQQAVAQNLIPRTIQGVRDWISKNQQLVMQAPGLQSIIQQIMTLPDAAAEVQVRALMPMFDQFIEPSAFKSEFNGKITSPQDRVTARDIIMAQGLPPSTASYHLSVLNKSGTLQDYHYAKPAADYGDELMNYNQALTQHGY